MTVVCGVDGCRAGWIVLLQDLSKGSLNLRLIDDIADLALFDPFPDAVAIDIPIGLVDKGGRNCDGAARKILGPGRASSVFTAPIRPLLEANDYTEACRMARRGTAP